MSEYLEAYKKRMEKVNNDFLLLAEQLKAQGCKVFAPKDKLINFIKVLKDNKNITVAFEEVPYSWRLSHALNPSEKQGSSRTIETSWDADTPPIADYIINKMVKNPCEINTTYLKEL